MIKIWMHDSRRDGPSEDVDAWLGLRLGCAMEMHDCETDDDGTHHANMHEHQTPNLYYLPNDDVHGLSSIKHVRW